MWRMLQESTRKLIDLDSLQSGNGDDDGVVDGSGGVDGSGAAASAGEHGRHTAGSSSGDGATHGDGRHSRLSPVPESGRGAGEGQRARSPDTARAIRMSEHVRALDALDTYSGDTAVHVQPRSGGSSGKHRDDAAGAQHRAVHERQALRAAGHGPSSQLSEAAARGAFFPGTAGQPGAGRSSDGGGGDGASMRTFEPNGEGRHGSTRGVGRESAPGNRSATVAARAPAAPTDPSRASVADALSSYYGITSTLASTGAALLKAGTGTAQYLAGAATSLRATGAGSYAADDAGSGEREASPVTITRPPVDYQPRPPPLVLDARTSVLAAALNSHRLPPLPDAVAAGVPVDAAELGIDMPSLAAAARGPTTAVEFAQWAWDQCAPRVSASCCRGPSSSTGCLPACIGDVLVARIAVPLQQTFGVSEGQALVLAVTLVVVFVASFVLLWRLAGGAAMGADAPPP